MKQRLHGWCLIMIFLVIPITVSADGLDEILARGKVRIGVAEFIPWTFKNRDGNLEGFEIDVGELIAHDMGVDAEFTLYQLDDLFEAAEKGEIDFIAAGLAITPHRALRVEFTSPYSRSGTTLVSSKARAAGATSPDDLNKQGMVIMVVADTFSEEIAQQVFDEAEIRVAADGPAAERELVRGSAHGYLTSLIDATILVNHYPDEVEMTLDEPLVGSVAGLAVKRGNQALLNYLNSWIAANIANRWLTSSHQYWFSGYDWAAHAPE